MSVFSRKEEAVDERLTAIQTKIDGLQVVLTIKYKKYKNVKTQNTKYMQVVSTFKCKNTKLPKPYYDPILHQRIQIHRYLKVNLPNYILSTRAVLVVAHWRFPTG